MSIPEANPCPHPKCSRYKPRENYACRTHWYSLPESIRRAIWKGYRSGAGAWAAADKQAREYWANQLESPAPEQGKLL